MASEKNTFTSVPVLGTNLDFIKIEPLALRFGAFLTESNHENAVVLGHRLSLALFNTINSTVGKTITIMGEKFMVVGVLDEVEQSINFDNIDFDNVTIPDCSIEETLAKHKQGDMNFTVAYGDAITHPASSLFVVVSSMLTTVAAISLVVGGIGVMNIMLVSVAERTHEIGVRKAVGASSRNILMQFLFESLILSILGGVFGLILGYTLAFLLSIVTPFAPYINIGIVAISLLTTLIIGIIFGIYPAIKAASRNPIESLKHYR